MIFNTMALRAAKTPFLSAVGLRNLKFRDQTFVEKDLITIKTLNIGTPRPATVVVLNLKQFNFTMKKCFQKM